MRTILFILLLLVGSVGQAAITGTVPVTAPVAPLSATDTYAAHDEQYGLGGYRTVADTTARDAIPSDRLKPGMLVHCLADGVVYKLDSTTNWVDSGLRTAVINQRVALGFATNAPSSYAVDLLSKPSSRCLVWDDFTRATNVWGTTNIGLPAVGPMWIPICYRLDGANTNLVIEDGYLGTWGMETGITTTAYACQELADIPALMESWNVWTDSEVGDWTNSYMGMTMAIGVKPNPLWTSTMLHIVIGLSPIDETNMAITCLLNYFTNNVYHAASIGVTTNGGYGYGYTTLGVTNHIQVYLDRERPWVGVYCNDVLINESTNEVIPGVTGRYVYWELISCGTNNARWNGRYDKVAAWGGGMREPFPVAQGGTGGTNPVSAKVALDLPVGLTADSISAVNMAVLARTNSSFLWDDFARTTALTSSNIGVPAIGLPWKQRSTDFALPGTNSYVDGSQWRYWTNNADAGYAWIVQHLQSTPEVIGYNTVHSNAGGASLPDRLYLMAGRASTDGLSWTNNCVVMLHWFYAVWYGVTTNGVHEWIGNFTVPQVTNHTHKMEMCIDTNTSTIQFLMDGAVSATSTDARYAYLAGPDVAFGFHHQSTTPSHAMVVKDVEAWGRKTSVLPVVLGGTGAETASDFFSRETNAMVTALSDFLGSTNSTGLVLDTIAELESYAGTITNATVLGFSAPGDGGGGTFFKGTTNAFGVIDGGVVVAHDDGATACWVRLESIQSPWKVEWFGAIPQTDGGATLTDCAPIISTAMQSMSAKRHGGTLLFGPGLYPLKTRLVITNDLNQAISWEGTTWNPNIGGGYAMHTELLCYDPSSTNSVYIVGTMSLKNLFFKKQGTAVHGGLYIGRGPENVDAFAANTYSIIQNCVFSYFNDSTNNPALQIDNVFGVTVQDCVFNSNGYTFKVGGGEDAVPGVDWFNWVRFNNVTVSGTSGVYPEDIDEDGPYFAYIGQSANSYGFIWDGGMVQSALAGIKVKGTSHCEIKNICGENWNSEHFAFKFDSLTGSATLDNIITYNNLYPIIIQNCSTAPFYARNVSAYTALGGSGVRARIGAGAGCPMHFEDCNFRDAAYTNYVTIDESTNANYYPYSIRARGITQYYSKTGVEVARIPGGTTSGMAVTNLVISGITNGNVLLSGTGGLVQGTTTGALRTSLGLGTATGEPMFTVFCTDVTNLWLRRDYWTATNHMLFKILPTNSTVNGSYNLVSVSQLSVGAPTLRTTAYNDGLHNNTSINLGDDIGPLYVVGNGYISGNHGWGCVYTITNSGPTFTEADLGKRFTNNATEWAIYRVTTTNFQLVGKCKTSGTQTNLLPSLSASTNLAALDGQPTVAVPWTWSPSREQLLPSHKTNTFYQKFLLDGATEYNFSSIGVCRFFDIVMYEEIISPSSMFWALTNAVGTNVILQDACPAYMARSQRVRFWPHGQISVIDNWESLGEQWALSVCSGPLQSGGISGQDQADIEIIRLPDVNGVYYDGATPWYFGTPQTMATLSGTAYMVASNYLSAAVPPDWMVQWAVPAAPLTTNNWRISELLAFDPEYGDTTPAKRLASCTNALGLSTTMKYYPHARSWATQSTTATQLRWKADFSFCAQPWYHGVTGVWLVRCDDSWHIYTTWEDNLTGTLYVPLPGYLIGKSASTIRIKNATLGNTMVEPSGINLTVSNTNGFAIIKLTPP